MKKLTIGIVTWNSADLLMDCLNSIKQNLTQIPYDIVVTDNGSVDNTSEMIRNHFSDILYIRNTRNEGVAKARNKCLLNANTKYVVLLDVDTIIHANAIETLMAFMDKHPQVGICGPKLMNPDGTLQLSCRTFQTPLTVLFRGTFLSKKFPNSSILKNHLMTDWNHDAARPVDWLLGACHMIRAEVIQSIGMLDEKFMYLYEDVEYCWRARNFGWEIFYVPESQITHIYQRKSAMSLNKMTLKHVHSMIRFMMIRFLGWRKLEQCLYL